MDARLNLFKIPGIGTFTQHLHGMNKAVTDSGIPETTQELVRLRVSQINGCGFCTDMHFKDAVAAGEDAVRLNMVAVWREATVFTPAERAALALAEGGTRIADNAPGVTDEVWDEVVKHYDEKQQFALILLVSIMNTVNRMNAINRTPAGSYVAGQFAH